MLNKFQKNIVLNTSSACRINLILCEIYEKYFIRKMKYEYFFSADNIK